MTRSLEEINFDRPLKVELLHDPIVDSLGHDTRSTYVEHFWLPILGPSTTWLVRHLVDAVERDPMGCTLDIKETARALGLGERPGRHGPFLRSIARAIDFDMARLMGPGTIAIRAILPALSARHLARLPQSLQRAHAETIQRADGSLAAMRQRGQRLALTLLELGEGVAETNEQLTRWRFHPALAHQCTRWAVRELTTHPSRAGRRTDTTPSPDPMTITPRRHQQPIGLAAR